MAQHRRLRAHVGVAQMRVEGKYAPPLILLAPIAVR
jgi:hypothetical protein